jgi:hypothetical protein
LAGFGSQVGGSTMEKTTKLVNSYPLATNTWTMS